MLARSLLQHASDLCWRVVTTHSRVAAPFVEQGLQSLAASNSQRSIGTVVAAAGSTDDSTEK